MTATSATGRCQKYARFAPRSARRDKRGEDADAEHGDADPVVPDLLVVDDDLVAEEREVGADVVEEDRCRSRR